MPNDYKSSCIASAIFTPLLKIALAFLVLMYLVISFFPSQFVTYRLNGIQLKVVKSTYYATFQKNDKIIPIKFELINQGVTPVIFLGSSNSCSCTLVDEIPPVLAARKSMTLSEYVKRDPINISIEFKGDIRLFTNIPSQPEIFLSYHLVNEKGS